MSTVIGGLIFALVIGAIVYLHKKKENANRPTGGTGTAPKREAGPKE